MGVEDIKRDFPNLENKSYDPPHSEEDFNYNCLAFVLGDRANWWEPGAFGHYWPPGFSKDTSIATAISILRLHGFVIEAEIFSTLDAESVAIYGKGDEWVHFAKFNDGKWWSKLGDGHDIWHSTLKELEGDLYGKVAKILSRKA